jgi:hypothetical protein
MSCSANSNKVVQAARRLGISKLTGKHAFYAATAAAAGVGVTWLVRMIKKAHSRRQATRAWVAAYNAAAGEINQLLREAGPAPEGEHTRYHFFDGGGGYAGWTHSEKAAPKLAALNGYQVVTAASTKTEAEVTQDFLAWRGSLSQAAANA